MSQDEFETNYNETKKRLAPYGARSDIWRLTSVERREAGSPTDSMDFVYIDARHDYESVLEDLNAWFDKVKPGGIFAGHDYVDGMLAQGDFGVKSAVDEFFAESGTSPSTAPRGRPPSSSSRRGSSRSRPRAASSPTPGEERARREKPRAPRGGPGEPR